MFAIERIKIIKNHLRNERKVSTAQLSELLNVSEVTIRRDLEKLESEGFLERTHGGAIIIDENLSTQEFTTDYSEVDHQEQQSEIADLVFHLIEEGSSIMLTDGTTNLQIAHRLSEKNNLTILTNDLRIGSAFSNNKNNTVIMLGGDLDGYATYGQIAALNMNNFHFTYLLIDLDGIGYDTGLMASSIKKATLMQQAMSLAEKTFAVCLSHQFDTKALFRVGRINDANKIITDSLINDQYKQQMFDLNLPLYTSINLYEA